MCATRDEQSGCRKGVSITEDRKNAVEVRSLKYPEAFSQLLNVSKMSKNSPVSLVYRRRKDRGASAAISEQAQTQTYLGVDPHGPAKSNEKWRASQVHHEAGHSGQFSVHKKYDLVYRRRKFQGRAADISEQTQRQPYQGVDPHNPAKSKEIRRASEVDHEAGDSRHGFVHKIHDSGEASKNISQSKEIDSVNDSCSSSKLNLEQVSVSMRTEKDGSGECSSSCTITVEDRGIEISAKELCISVLKNAVSLGVRPKRSSNRVEDGTKSCSRLCKICGKSEATLKMLICDNCEEAFHVNCCNARVKKITNEWFCSSCLKLKRNVLKETRAIKTLHISREQGRCNSLSQKDESDNIATLLKDTRPYRRSVKVGTGFQADIPDWLGLANYKVDAIDEPLEIDPSECLSLQKLNFTENSTFSSIGNWLQCRERIDGVGGASGTVCGKWRRAPLSEVQTDNWECFCSVLWDPSHADCNVLQELETCQVLKQLKYVEMLRPRLDVKRRKMDSLTKDDN